VALAAELIRAHPAGCGGEPRRVVADEYTRRVSEAEGRGMAIGIIMEFDGFKPENYDAVSQRINWPKNWPDGLTFHVAGPTNGGMRLVEIWDSRDQFDRWMAETIQPAIQEVTGEHGRAAGPPPRFTEFAVHRQEAR
jgi:hypothetical protein